MDSSAKITKIEVQKKKKTRRSIYLNDEFAFGLDAELVAHFGLKEGDELSQEKINNLLLKEEKKRVKEKAYRYLAARAHSEKEIRIKLVQKGFSSAIVDEVISELKEKSFVDDEAFALSFVRSRMVNKPAGEILLRRELWQKGISEEIIQKALQEAYSEKNQLEFAKELVDKRRSRYKNLEDSKRKKRLTDFLLRRGFEWELVKEVIQETFE
ncbi:MAG: RecX family transcriptional regulator [bacterium]